MDKNDPLLAFRVNLEQYLKLYDLLDKFRSTASGSTSSSTTSSSASTARVAALDALAMLPGGGIVGPGMAGTFADEYSKYRQEIQETAKDLASRYKAFKKMIDAQATFRKTGPSRENLADYQRCVEKTKALSGYRVGDKTPDGEARDRFKSYLNRAIAHRDNFIQFETQYGKTEAHTQLEESTIKGWTEIKRQADNNLYSSSDRIGDKTGIDSNLHLDNAIEWANGLGKIFDAKIYAGRTDFDGFLLMNESNDPFLEPEMKVGDLVAAVNLLSTATLFQRLGNLLGKKDAVKYLARFIEPLPKGNAIRDQIERIRVEIDRSDTTLYIANMNNTRPTELETLLKTLKSSNAIWQLSAELKKSEGDSLINEGSSGMGASSSGDSAVLKDPSEFFNRGANFMYRALDLGRVNAYRAQLEAHSKLVKDFPIATEAQSQSSMMIARRLELARQFNAEAPPREQDPATRNAMRRSLSNAKMTVYLEFCNSIRRIVAKYVAMHVDFLANRHNEGTEYMNYWSQFLPVLKSDAPQSNAKLNLTKYREAKEAIAKKIASQFAEVSATVRGVYEHDDKNDDQLTLDEEQSGKINDAVTDLLVWMTEQEVRVTGMYERGALPIIDAVTDPKFIAMYGLKLLRVGIAWYALRIAGKVFQTRYERDVYENQKDPPSPLWFVAMFMGIDLAINALVLAVLVVLGFTLGPASPFDAAFLRVWVIDYLAVSLTVGVIAMVIGHVVQLKKYFRFKYEGDRAIRAMREMCLYTYAVMLCIPFFRIGGG